MIRRHQKTLLLLFLAGFFVAAYAFVFLYVNKTRQRLGITDEIIIKSRQDQAALCPSGFVPMASSSRCFNLKGLIVPKRKDATPKGESSAGVHQPN